MTPTSRSPEAGREAAGQPQRARGARQPAEPPVCLPPDPATREPAARLPAGSTDCHCHVYEQRGRYPLVADRSYTPAEATLDAYLAMCDAIGLTRTVQVSASVYGTDNALTLDVIARLGPDRARGIAGLSPAASDAEIARLHRGGMRGVRVSTHVRGYGGTDAMTALADRIRPFGWHLQVHVHQADEIAALEDRLMALPVPIVFDHLGCVRGRESPSSPGFQAMLRLLARRDDCWAKISSWYRRSDAGPPWDDMRPMVEAMVMTRADRLVFGTNWPHPALFAPDRVPDDADLVECFQAWVPDAGDRRRILVDNPAALYGFDPIAA